MRDSLDQVVLVRYDAASSSDGVFGLVEYPVGSVALVGDNHLFLDPYSCSTDGECHKSSDNGRRAHGDRVGLIPRGCTSSKVS